MNKLEFRQNNKEAMNAIGSENEEDKCLKVFYSFDQQL